MIQSLRQIKSRIRTIENTKKLTRAMEMISVVKLNRSNTMLNTLQRYFLKIESLLTNILSGDKKAVHPFLEERSDTRKIALCLITTDMGLCGAYNHNIFRVTEKFLNRRKKDRVRLIVLGKKGFNYLRKKGFDILHSYIGLNGRFSNKVSDGIVKTLMDLFLSGEVSEVYIAYTKMGTAFRYIPVIEKFLNIDIHKGEKTEYIFEPNISRIIEELLPVYIANKMRIIILNAFASEHRARAVAMGEATENAKELLETMILLRNKVRQAGITKEMLEIISSAEALKG